MKKPSQLYQDNIESLIADFENMGGMDPFIRPKRMQDIIISLTNTYGLSPKTTRTWLQHAGVLHKKGATYPKHIYDMVLDMLRDNQRVTDIAKRVYGVHRSTVSLWAKENGITPFTFRRSRRLPDLEIMNVNTATFEEMIKAPEIGEETANKIINNRPFNTLDQVEELFMVGPKKMLKVDRYFYVGSATQK